MFESLISSRIRRTLLDYLVAHPDHRFYLRGLARELQLPVSPLRRELKRLEDLGVLRAYDEGNMRFYLVAQANPEFLQLQQALHPSPVAIAAAPVVVASSVARPVAASSQNIVRNFAASMLVIGLLAGMVWMGMHSRQLVGGRSLQHAAVTTPAGVSDETVTGEMHSTRWRLTPGAMGGFSSGSQ